MDMLSSHKYNISLAEFFNRLRKANNSEISCTLKEEGIQGIKHSPISDVGFYLVQRPTKLSNKRVFTVYYHKALSNPSDTIVHYGPFADISEMSKFASILGEWIIKYE